jgi:transketolase
MGIMGQIKSAYSEMLAELGKSNDKIIALDADLQACSLTDVFSKDFPARQFNVGIAECNMVGIAAGLATCGKIPFVHSFAIFTAGRAYDQIRNSVAYPNLNVKIMGMYAGFTNGEDGATHQCFEDLSIMRVVPNMKVFCPSDANEMKELIKAIVAYNGPCYVRMPRSATETFTDYSKYKFEIGKGIQLREGKDVTIIGTGIMVQYAMYAAEILQKENISTRVIDMHTIKPIDEEIIIKAAKETGAVVTTEEHNILGGLGGAVAEVLAENCAVSFVRHGVKDSFGKSGKFELLLQKYGLTAEEIVKCVKKVIARKK